MVYRLQGCKSHRSVLLMHHNRSYSVAASAYYSLVIATLASRSRTTAWHSLTTTSLATGAVVQ